MSEHKNKALRYLKTLLRLEKRCFSPHLITLIGSSRHPTLTLVWSGAMCVSMSVGMTLSRCELASSKTG